MSVRCAALGVVHVSIFFVCLSLFEIGRKCSVFGCRSGYRNEPKRTVYKFPKDKEKCRAWVSKLPNVLKVDDVMDFMGVCSLH